jgi:4-amino-4-deoxy-L-arabinose transferase-like glycosyltransferase
VSQTLARMIKPTFSLTGKRTRRIAIILFLIALAFTVRGLTANFIHTNFNDPGWFPSGIYAAFDAPAQAWLDGRASIFWIEDASRTDKATYAPGYPLWIALIYKLTGSRSPATVLNVQWPLDSLAVLLVMGIGVTAFNRRVGFWAGGIAALWPLLAIYGVEPLADAPTSWIVLGAAWMLLLAARRKSVRWALGGGALIGLSCWFRANALLLVFFWAGAILILVKAGWKQRAFLAAAVVVAGVLVIAPIIVRNAIAFHAFVPTGLGAGTNLLEGIGDTERGAREFGAPASDNEVIQQERAALQVPDRGQFDLYYPNGIERDRARTRRALGIIARHPFWYAGTVVQRAAAVLKYAGKPSGIYGSAGINVTSKKCLPASWQGGVLAVFVNALGMLQSVLRFVLLPLMVIGAGLALRENWRVSGLIFSTIVYYLVIGSLIHTHIRYGLPMQALLTVFAGFFLNWIIESIVRKRFSSSHSRQRAHPAR